MTKHLSNAIRELSDIFDKDSKDTFVSLYMNKGFDKNFLKRRINACKSILKESEFNNFNETIKDMQKIIKKNNDNNFALFSSHINNFNRYIPLDVKVENLLVVDSSPYIRPIVRILDEWESYTLVIINSNSAKIFSISMGSVDDIKKLSKDIMNKHKKGGWSQARFNRLRRGAIKEFFKEVIEELEKRSDERIVLAGPGTSKNKLKEMLPKTLQEKIVELIDISVEDEDKLIKQSIQLISENEKRKSSEAVNHLKAEILKEGLAVYGVKETLDAVKNGQVELLIIEKDYKLKGWICENCQYVEEGSKSTCPYCNKETSEVDVFEEILEFAERTDSKVEFTDDEQLADLGHIGGILRYK